VGVTAGAIPAVQQGPRDQLVVSVDWLAAHLSDPDLVLLHVGPKEAYEAEHIPGGRFVDLRSQLAAPHGPSDLILELPDPSALKSTLEGLGISSHSRIVVYWANEWVTPAARAIFTLDWAGLGPQTSLLDGGIEAWKAAGQPVTSDAPAPRAGSVTLRPRRDLVVNADWVQRELPRTGFALVDGRARSFYDGVQADRGKEGHIPGAASVPWTELIDPSLKLKSPDELRRIFAAARVAPGDTVVAYCHIGQYATLVLLAARTLGHPVRLYDGAFQDWAGRNLPVEKPGGGR
jgi:thiosulfate/3-mercaptopyruvate sulfurtransferase